MNNFPLPLLLRSLVLLAPPPLSLKACLRHHLQHTWSKRSALRFLLRALRLPFLVGSCGLAPSLGPTWPLHLQRHLNGAVKALLPQRFHCLCPTWASSGAVAHGSPVQNGASFIKGDFCACLALNFVHDGFRRPPDHLLWRLPNAHQRQAYQRMMKLIRACDCPGEDYLLPPGRSGFEFVARLLELEAFASQAGFGPGSSYNKACPSVPVVPVVEPSANLPQLHPYRSLDTSRLKLSGKGTWGMDRWLEGPLWLPFREPAILHHGLGYDPSSIPSFSFEDRAENLRLAGLWHSQGLLRLEKGPPAPLGRRRVFNAYKSAERDRQIGDRRLPNHTEMHLTGPSAALPAGTAFLSLEPPKHSHRLVAFVSDRKDYYHQACVSAARSRTNCLPFSYTGRELADLGIHDTGRGLPRSILCPSQAYTPSFTSLFQGDHLGVEFALESHWQMLESFGAIRPELALLNRQPPPLGPDVQALVIDDFVCVSALPRGAPASSSVAARLHGLSQQAYTTEGVEGSPEKDVLGADRFQAVGAEIMSDHRCLSEGILPCGAPLARRIPLAALSLRAAALPVTSSAFCAR